MAKTKGESRKSSKTLVSIEPEVASEKKVDTKLADLFSSSIPRAPPNVVVQAVRISHRARGEPAVTAENRFDADQNGNIPDDESAASPEPGKSLSLPPLLSSTPAKPRKRKRGEHEDNLEGQYLKRLALQEQKETVISHDDRPQHGSTDDAASNTEEIDPANDEEYEIPLHESLMPSTTEQELDKAARTVFLGNVSTLAIKSRQSKKVLTDHLCSIFSTMKDSQDQNLESMRFRSTAFANGSIPKKAAFAKKELMDATTKSTNAYAVYSTTSAAREAVKSLNGTIILDRHLRVDSVAHPSPIDHRRCVFVGNLGFVDDESNIRASETADGQQRAKAKVAADVEEGLWVHFAKAGPVESVRVVRDRNTRVGKGIAYVQFKDPNSVEKALLFSDKKFPPMLPRKLRVTRARKLKKATSIKTKATKTDDTKQSARMSSLGGRANKLLGKAGGYHVRKNTLKSPEDIVFEGHRAVPGSKRSKEGKEKKKDRRTDRSAAYRSKR